MGQTTLYKIKLHTTFKRAFGCVLLFLFLNTLPVNAQKPPLEYQVKAAFIFNFTKFVNWPPVAFSAPNAPFVIGIIGTNPFGSYLNELVEGERIGNHPIIVQRYHDIKEIGNCQLLFINYTDPVKIREVLSAIDLRYVLTVGDDDGFLNSGGEVKLFKENNKIKIQINMAAARAAQFEISSKLLRIAKL